MIVCQCRVVTCSGIAAAQAEGASTLAAVCHRTGAGQTCGGCVLGVRRVMDRYAGGSVPAGPQESHAAPQPARRRVA